MASALLTSKLQRPPLRPNLVSRPRLVERIDQGVQLGRRLTLLSAPPGSGKTTLAVEWAAQAARPVAWFTLDESDADPAQFLHYLIAALAQLDSRLGQTALTVLKSQPLLPVQGILGPLINDLAAVPPLALVLDDYQTIASPPVHEAIQYLLDHLPAGVHLLLSTRADPPFNLGQLRARAQLTEIRERDLRFTPEEAAEFLNRAMGLGLSPEAVRQVETRTEGWIAGLQLAALALQQGPENAEEFIAQFAGHDRYIVDFLAAEVFQRQPPTVQDFLRQTATLDRLTASLCDAVTGREDSQAVLEGLDRANLFIIPLDNRREWYRYHHLFAEFLRARLSPEEQASLHRRAMTWHEAHGNFSRAIRHALAFGLPTGELADAERLIRAAADETIHGGGLLTAAAWLEALPESRIRADGVLATYKGWTSAITGDLAQAAEYSDIANDLLRRQPASATDLGRALALEGFVALLHRRDPKAATVAALEAQRYLPEEQGQWRIIALWARAEALERLGDITQSIETLRLARQLGFAYGNPLFVSTVLITLALSLNHQGRLAEAKTVCQEGIAELTDPSGNTSPVAGMLFSRLGALHYEDNRLAEAAECNERAAQLVRQLSVEPYLVLVEGLAAPALFARGDPAAALAVLGRARGQTAEATYLNAEWFEACEATLRLRQGDAAYGARWLEARALSPETEPDYMALDAHLAGCRLLLALGRADKSHQWLARLERFARERSLTRSLLTISALQALTADKLNDRQAARNYLARAVELAAPEGYVRAFLDEDPRILELLPSARPIAPDLVDRVLAAAPTPPAPPEEEQLSGREREVLRLISDGLSNQEIADRLVIAVSTVKTHINNLYGKLGVRGRVQALSRARERNLV